MNSIISNKRGSALIIALIITIVLSLMMSVLLEKIIPVSRQVRGIENATLAAYQAETAIERALYGIRIKAPGKLASGTIPGILSSTGAPSNTFTASLTGGLIPLAGEGNSEYDRNWNRIAMGKPVQLILPAGLTVNEFKEFEIDFQVPEIKPGADFLDNSRTIDLPSGSGVINWTLSQKNGTGVLISDTKSSGPSMFTVNNINSSNSTSPSILSRLKARSADEAFSGGILSDFYPSVLGVCPNGCTLKISLVSELTNKDGNKIPYLEYRVRGAGPSPTLSFSPSVPLQYATITADGLAYGYKQTRIKSIRQLTTSEALDFAVFQ